MSAATITNLIFDLGGVILELSVDDTLEAFSKLSGIEKREVERIFTDSPEFNLYEKGGMSDQEFRDFVRKAYNLKADDAELDKCWNAMLLGIPFEKLELLDRLKNEYRVFLLSNTNGIHLDYINEMMLKRMPGARPLDTYFHKAYYSHRMLKRKPEPEIFQQVLDENQLDPQLTLFLDDNAYNIHGAKALGIQTTYITYADQILDIFND